VIRVCLETPNRHGNLFATIAGELAEKKRRDKKAAATLRKFEWFMSFTLPALGSRPIGEISARDEFWDERVKMMTWWANRCDELRRCGQIISIAAATG
jgi:hypothetical protein